MNQHVSVHSDPPVQKSDELRAALTLIQSHLARRQSVPDCLFGDQEEQVLLRNILDTITSAQNYTLEISEGKLNTPIELKGVFGGALKNLQSNLRHLTYKTQMIAKGDFTQQVDFLYDFSVAFNSMVRELDQTKKALIMKTEELQNMVTSLKVSSEQYRSLIQKSPVSICLVHNGQIILTNPLFLNLLGATNIEQVVGQLFIRFIHPCNTNTFLEKMDLYSGNGNKSIAFEERLVRLDEKEIIAEIIGTDIFFENKPVTLFLISDVTARRDEESKILNTLQEKDILLKEVYHRVKNNMQIIWSLLSMQSRQVEDETVKGYFIECQNRVKSLALVHEQLYRADNLQEINYGQYLKQIASHLFNTYNLNAEQIHLRIEVSNDNISLVKAVPCSLIINELISNSLKYAFLKEKSSIITIRFETNTNSQSYLLDYRDTGPGIPPEIKPESTNTLGMKLIFGLTRQLKGTVFFENDNGVHYMITFPVD
jgi:PAS domain S-box-containing protein